jgi:muramoyltetrapeptide carboxypeptidase
MIVKRGARVAVVAPASDFNEAKLAAGLDIARGLRPDLDFVRFDGIKQPLRNLAAPDDVRLDHLFRALSDPEWDAVWCVRGGYGVTRIIERIPFDALRPKPLIGFSDLTPLLDALASRVGSPAIHGPMLHSLPETDDASRRWLADLLDGEPLPALPGDAWVPGTAAGPLVGGNLCMLAAACGTPYQTDARGCVLVLEEINEEAYKVDRLLQQLRSAGVLDGVVGVAVGEMKDCDGPANGAYSVDDVLQDHLGRLGVPVLAHLPVGHGSANRAFVVRSDARIADGALLVGAAAIG